MESFTNTICLGMFKPRWSFHERNLIISKPLPGGAEAAAVESLPDFRAMI